MFTWLNHLIQGGNKMVQIKSESVWTEWHETGSKHYLNYMGGYILEYKVELKVDSYILNESDEGRTVIGNATIHLIDEEWVNDKNGYSLEERVHMDFNDEVNWNATTLYEYLEDALICSNYGKKDGVSGTIAVLHSIEIFEEYRGNGLFDSFLSDILKTCSKFKVDYVVLTPQPFGENLIPEDEIKRLTNKLISFYTKYGFRHTISELKVRYMALSMKQYSLNLKEALLIS